MRSPLERWTRIHQAIAPAGLNSSAVVYSMFIADHGLYMIRTGHGWRMNVRGGRYRPERMVNDVRHVEAELDPMNLAAELVARAGSVFIPGAELSDVQLRSRLDGLPDLRFKSGARKYRVQFDEHRRAEVEQFVAELLTNCTPGSVGGTGETSRSDQHTIVSVEGSPVETVSLPSPCWGATPYVAVADARLFVEYLAPTGQHHGEKSVLYRSTDDEQARFAVGELDVTELCQRLVGAVWGSTPPARGDG